MLFSLLTYSSVDSITLCLNIVKSVLLLMMDDDQQIREDCVKILKRRFPGEFQDKVPCFVQEQFLEKLEIVFPLLEKSDIIAIILAIIIDNDDGQNSLEENIADFKVFDKCEVNIFSESFVVKKKCREIIKSSEFVFDDVIQTAQQITQRKSSSTSYSAEKIQNFLISIMK